MIACVDWILTIENDVSFNNSTKYCIWGLDSTNKMNTDFMCDVKSGDRLWFLKNDSGYKLIAVANYVSHNSRELGALVNMTMTNEELGWSIDCVYDKEVHYNNLYMLTDCMLSINNYNSVRASDSFRLRFEYSYIVKYRKPEKIGVVSIIDTNNSSSEILDKYYLKKNEYDTIKEVIKKELAELKLNYATQLEKERIERERIERERIERERIERERIERERIERELNDGNKLYPGSKKNRIRRENDWKKIPNETQFILKYKVNEWHFTYINGILYDSDLVEYKTFGEASAKKLRGVGLVDFPNAWDRMKTRVNGKYISANDFVNRL